MEDIYEKQKKEWEQMMIETSGPNHGIKFHSKYLKGDAKDLEAALKELEIK